MGTYIDTQLLALETLLAAILQREAPRTHKRVYKNFVNDGQLYIERRAIRL